MTPAREIVARHATICGTADPCVQLIEDLDAALAERERATWREAAEVVKGMAYPNALMNIAVDEIAAALAQRAEGRGE